MQNNSGDLCLLIGIYSFILFYLLLWCVCDRVFFSFLFIRFAHFLPSISFVCVCVFEYRWIYLFMKRVRQQIRVHHYSQFIRTTIINIISNTHTLSIISSFFLPLLRITQRKNKKSTELTFAQTVIMWSLWMALLILNGYIPLLAKTVHFAKLL